MNPYSNGNLASYSTTVTIPATRTATTTTQIYATSQDICLNLDLQAVGAAFAQSSTVKEFEALLNNSSYIISNLDLNGDGYVDYLRVVETYEGNTHVFVIQAVLGDNIYQDVATVVAEDPHLPSYRIEIIGAPYIYGPSYYVHPVFVARPLILDHFCRHDYSPWHSPWHWGYFPSYYRRPAPVFLSHYEAYVHTFMNNHHYCHEAKYPATCHYADYDRVSRPLQRNDYGQQHPERSFTVRNAQNPSGVSAVDRADNAGRQVVNNANDVRTAHEASKVTTSRSTSRSSATSGTSTGSRSAATSGTSTGTSSRSTATGSSSSRSGSYTGGSSVSSGSRSASTSTGSGTSSRSGSTSQTTVRSNVRSSGSSVTNTRTVSSSGAQSTVRRGSSSSSSVSSGSSSSSVSSGSRSSSASSGTRSVSSSASRSASSSSGSRSTGSSSGSSSRR